jgi:hypothetical protein
MYNMHYYYYHHHHNNNYNYYNNNNNYYYYYNSHTLTQNVHVRVYTNSIYIKICLYA